MGITTASPPAGNSLAFTRLSRIVVSPKPTSPSAAGLAGGGAAESAIDALPLSARPLCPTGRARVDADASPSAGACQAPGETAKLGGQGPRGAGQRLVLGGAARLALGHAVPGVQRGDLVGFG